jgi:hypothetical protein
MNKTRLNLVAAHIPWGIRKYIWSFCFAGTTEVLLFIAEEPESWHQHIRATWPGKTSLRAIDAQHLELLADGIAIADIRLIGLSMPYFREEALVRGERLGIH